MRKNTLMMLTLGLSFLMSAKCLGSNEPGIGNPPAKELTAGSKSEDPKNLKDGPAVKSDAVPSNDNCANATAITTLPYSYAQTDGINATNDGFVTTCTGYSMNDGLWYTVVGDGTNIAITVTPTTDYYVQLGIYTGSCGNLACTGTVDAALENNPETYIVYNSVPGTTYYINVGRNNGFFDSSEGNFIIDVQSIANSTNNDCANATAVTSLPYSNSQLDGANITNSGGITACGGSINEGAWYTVVGDGGNIKITVTPVTGGSYNPVIGIFTGSCGEFECVSSIDATGGGTPETLIIQGSISGTVYYVNIGSYDNHMGSFSIDFSSILTPANDACSGALEITTLPYSHQQNDALGSTNNDGFLSVCGDESMMNDGLWYTIAGNGNSIKITVAPAENNFDIQLGVYSGTCGALECVGSGDSLLEGGTESYIIVNSVIGTTYYMNIGAYNDNEDKPEGNFTIDVKNVVVPANDACTGSIAITAMPYSHEQTDGVNATNNTGSIVACEDHTVNDGVWYTVVGDGNNILVNVTPEGDFDPEIGVFTGDCDALECVGRVDDSWGGSEENFMISNSLVGNLYYINVASFGGDTDLPEGNFTINVTSITPVANDACSGATAITSMPYSHFQSDSAFGTNNDGFIGSCDDSSMNDGLWYTVTGDGNYIIINVTSEEGDQDFDSKIGVSKGDCFNLECVGSADDTYYGSETYTIENSIVGATYYINVGSADADFDAPEGNFTIDVKSVPLPSSTPDCVSNVIYPANGAVEIPVGNTTVTWEAPTTGTQIDSYDLYASTSLPITEDDFVGNYTTTSANVTLTGYDTLFYWEAVPRNLAGQAEGCTEWSFTTVSPPPAPANDACSTATNVTTYPFTDTLDATNATNNDGFISACQYGMNDGIWYTVTGNGSDITIAATSVNWDGKLGIYTGSCGDFTCYASADSGYTGGTETLVISNSQAGTVYYINFGQYSGTNNNPEGFAAVTFTTTALGVGNNEFKNFVAYPNPVKDILNLSYSQNITNVAVFNLLGQQVIAKAINANQSQIDMSSLSSGTYMVKVTADNTVKTIKVVKQ